MVIAEPAVRSPSADTATLRMQRAWQVLDGVLDPEVPLRFMPRAAAAPALDCPHCGSHATERLSAFGSTACKALYRCLACREPFEHFKPL